LGLGVLDMDGVGMGGGTYDENACSYSNGDFEPEEKRVSAVVLLAEMLEYVYGPKTKEEIEFEETYSDANWHAKSWYLRPSPIELFLQLWDAKVQRKLVGESNTYCLSKKVPNVGGETAPPHL
jgi:hypothetical protein